MLTKLLSSDSHIIEPPNLWTERLPADLRERGPQVRRVEPLPGLRSEHEGEVDYWFVDGAQTSSSFAQVTRPGQRFEVDPRDIPLETKVDSMREGRGIDAFSPDNYVNDNLEDHVVGSVLYPTTGLILFGTPDSALCSAIFRAYNDYLAEFCSAQPKHLRGLALLNVDDPNEAAAELQRARNLGLVGAMIAVAPPPDKPYDLPFYDPLWAAAQDADMPLSLHLGTNRAAIAGSQAKLTQVSPAIVANAEISVRMSLAQIILTGVFERFPRLKIGAIEHELGWLPFFLDRLDYTYTQRPHRVGWHRFEDGAAPSDFWGTNCFASFQEDPTLEPTQFEKIGVETLTFGSDYPHVETTFPRSVEILDKVFAGVPESDQKIMGFGNAARLYGFDL